MYILVEYLFLSFLCGNYTYRIEFLVVEKWRNGEMEKWRNGGSSSTGGEGGFLFLVGEEPEW